MGLRYAMARGHWEAVWLLNNDAGVTSDALQELVENLERDHGTAGMGGSTLMHYGAPEIVQSLGGCRYNKWLALPASVGAGSNSERVEKIGLTNAPLSYVAGASMLVSMEMLREVGLMSEEYFLHSRSWTGLCERTAGTRWLMRPEASSTTGRGGTPVAEGRTPVRA